MGDASGDESPSPQEFIEEALIEAHHLANLTGLDEAKLARSRLVNAQSASRRTKTRDLLADACEYLELARMERRDAGAGFAKARRHARNAEVELRHESPLASDESILDLLTAGPGSDRPTLEDRRREVAVGSYDGLRRETALELAFAEIRSQTTDGIIEEPNALDDGSAVEESVETSVPANPEEAIKMASLEVDIRRSLQNAHRSRAEAEFQFLSSEQLSPAETSESP